ncbi:MAG: hypothetical protein RDU25_00460 [Patescibacteria group bacterium]|nr:hypothetical protein [Patescibacteria group bacterium]
MLEEIQATFRLSNVEGNVSGKIDSDPKGRNKIVFVTRDKYLMPPYLRHHRVEQGERWICHVIRDTKPHDPAHGALIVALSWPIFLKFNAAYGRTILVPQFATEMLKAQPEVLACLEYAIADVVLPEDGSDLGVEVDMGEPIAKNRLIRVGNVGYDETCDFAFRSGRHKPSRVTMVEPTEDVSTVVIWANRNVKGDPKSYVLRTAYIGTLSPREPWACRNEEELCEKSFPFWTGHALAYDPATMSPIFRTSWREVIESRAEVLRELVAAPQVNSTFSHMRRSG